MAVLGAPFQFFQQRIVFLGIWLCVGYVAGICMLRLA
jgi:hypothetical protein